MSARDHARIARWAAALAGAATLGLAAAAASAAPFPSWPRQVAGTGTERTAGTGVFDGERFRLAGAVLRWKEGIAGNALELYLFSRPGFGCDIDFSGQDGLIYVPLALAQAPRRLPVGRPIVPTLASFKKLDGPALRTIAIDDPPGRVVLTRIDTRRGGTWRGRILVPTQRSPGGETASVKGTFAARWCGDQPFG